MRIAGIIHGSRANGPGLRTCVWLQGCFGLDCPGCQNPQTHDPGAGRLTDPWSLAWELTESAEAAPLDTEGVTISGGEPMQQSLALLELLRTIKDLRPQWSLGMFTGYTSPELTWFTLWPQIRQHLDWALVGRWDRTQAVAAGFAPSANQKLLLFTARHSEQDFARMVEFSIAADGLTTITGFPGKGGGR